MRHDDKSLPPIPIDSPVDLTPEMTAWQDAHEPTVTIRVWTTLDGKTLMRTVWAKGLSDAVAVGEHDAMHEMADAVAAVYRTIQKIALALALKHGEREVMESVKGDN